MKFALGRWLLKSLICDIALENHLWGSVGREKQFHVEGRNTVIVLSRKLLVLGCCDEWVNWWRLFSQSVHHKGTPYISHLNIKIKGKEIRNFQKFFSCCTLLNSSGFVYFHNSFQSHMFGKIKVTKLVFVAKTPWSPSHAQDLKIFQENA